MTWSWQTVMFNAVSGLFCVGLRAAERAGHAAGEAVLPGA